MDDLVSYDIKKTCPNWVMNAFDKSLYYISKSNHTLKNNYQGKELKLDKMASFIVVLDKKESNVICFSGLQIDSWEYPIARVSSRHYFSEKYAAKYLRKQINWKICVAEQIKVALEQNHNKMFFSTELSTLDKIFHKQCYRSSQAINKFIPNVKIVPLKDQYDTTGKPSWQRIGQVIVDNKYWNFPLDKKETNGEN